tara:strand:+ start:1953 stop:2675 length:723 start_codon:yes stop_codon:yes gene_type:complete
MKYNIKHFDIIDSTNSYAINLRQSEEFKEGLVITTNFQKKGQGQRGSIWESQEGKNILLSAVFEFNILIKKQFDICKIVSLSITKFLSNLNINAKIKWPNDILVNNKKIAGILINNIISKDLISYSVIGIGLNVNQHVFNKYIPMATSIFLETGLQNNIEKMQHKLLEQIKFDIVNYFKSKNISSKYLDFLYRINKVSFFESGSQKFNGVIRGVEDSGLLLVETENEIIKYNTKEIKMIF